MRHSTFRSVVLAVVGLLTSATLASAQVGPCGVPIGPLLPDLIVDQQAMASQIYVASEQYTAKSCNIVEGSLSQAGNHTLLRFLSSTPNIGQTALHIGDPNQCPALFHFAECHQHFHFMQYADYRVWTVPGYQKWLAARDLSQPSNTGPNQALLDAATASGELMNGRKVGGHKQGFCMADVARYPVDGIEPVEPAYLSCSSNQGLSIGWADQYGPYLDGQFVEITDIPDGVYVLEDHVNPAHVLPEADYTNNSSAVTFKFTAKKGKTGPAIEIIP
jgi:hypothetical protein